MRRANTKLNVIEITTGIFNKSFSKRGKQNDLSSTITHLCGYVMFSPTNDSQRLQGYQNVCLEFSIRLLTFSVHNKRSFLRLYRSVIWKSKSIFWPQAITYHTSISYEEKKFKHDVTVSDFYSECFLFMISISNSRGRVTGITPTNLIH